VHDTGLSPSDVRDMTAAWGANMEAVQTYIIAHNAMNWQLFYNDGPMRFSLAIKTLFSLATKTLFSLATKALFSPATKTPPKRPHPQHHCVQ
jgi:hypothetical protein